MRTPPQRFLDAFNAKHPKVWAVISQNTAEQLRDRSRKSLSGLRSRPLPTGWRPTPPYSPTPNLPTEWRGVFVSAQAVQDLPSQYRRPPPPGASYQPGAHSRGDGSDIGFGALWLGFGFGLLLFDRLAAVMAGIGHELHALAAVRAGAGGKDVQEAPGAEQDDPEHAMLSMTLTAMPEAIKARKIEWT